MGSRLRVVMLLVAGCAGGGGEGGSEARLEAAGRVHGLSALHRDVALLCEEAPQHGDHADAVPDCDAAVIEADGRVRRLGRGGLLGAARLGDGALLLHTRDLRALRRGADGRELLLAEAVADPRVADDGRLLWTELPRGTTEYSPGLSGRIVLVDLARGTRRVVTDDPMASSPFVVPGSGDVLYVSARTGVASLWLASPGRAPRQLTNVGARRVGPGFVPVPGRELVFEPGTRRAVFTASYGGESTLWRVDVDSGAAEALGPGRMPAVGASGGLVALRDGLAVPL